MIFKFIQDPFVIIPQQIKSTNDYYNMSFP